MRTVWATVVALLISAPAVAQTHVAAGGNLQTAINAAVGGDTITLEAGAVWTGNYTLPTHTGAAITIRTVTADGSLGAGFAGQTAATIAARQAVLEPLMPTIRTTNGTGALATTGAANDWILIGIIFEASNAVTNGTANIVQLGDGLISSEAALPVNITIDRCLVRAVSGGTAGRGIQAQAANVIIRKTAVRNVRTQAAESHSISSWNSPGPFLIENNYIEAASIGTLFGGAAPSIAGLVPSDITYRWNYVTRLVAWQSDTGYGIKNLFELKNAQRVTVYGNIFENNWLDGQSGFAIVFTVRANSATGAPQSTVRDVLFENNIVRHTAAAFNVLGIDNQSCGAGCTNLSMRMQRVTIRNNLIHDVSRQTWVSPLGAIAVGTIMQIDGAPENLTVEYNTFMGAATVTGNIIVFSGDPLPGFVYRRNIAQKLMQSTGWPYDSFGVFGNAVGEGNPALATYTTDPGAPFANTVFADNVLAGCTAATYNNWPGNLFPTVATLHTQFVDAPNGNFRLINGSAYAGYGMDQDAIETAIAGGEPAPPQGPGPKRRFRWRL